MNWFQYLLQANIYFILLYGLYFLLLRNETFFRLNRIYLLGSAILSFLIPALQIDWVRSLFITEQVRQTTKAITVIIYESAPAIAEAKATVAGSWTIINWFTFIYLAGAGIFLCRFIWKLAALYLNSTERSGVSRAQSFFKKIIISEDLEGRDTIMEHEKVHSLEWHSADVLFFEFITVINWFNPVVYACKTAIKYIHEFIADEIASETQPSKEEYSLLLVSNIFRVETQKLSNGFFGESLIKRRIIMLHKSKSNRTALLKYGLSIPLFLAMLVFSAATIDGGSIEKYAGTLQKTKFANLLNEIIVASKNVIPTDTVGKKTEGPHSLMLNEVTIAGKILLGDSLMQNQADNLEVASPASKDSVVSESAVTTAPTFPGGSEGWMKFLQKYNYPIEARESNASGKVYVRFYVEKDGSLTNVTVIRDIGFGTGEEAVKLLRSSPRWSPGTVNGEPIRTSYTQPITLNIVPPPAVTPERLDLTKTLSTEQLEMRPKSSNTVYIVNGRKSSAEALKKLNPSLIKQVSVRVDRALAAKYGEPETERVVEVTKKPISFGWKQKISSLFFKQHMRVPSM